ncbi:MAG: hypothetical protein ABWX96_07515 [Propionibacteriaceae bacterium]
MGYLRDLDETDVGPQAQQLFAEERAEQGYVANYTQLFARRPEVNAAWENLSGAIRSGMDRRRYHLVTLIAARGLRSSYCALAHGSRLAGLVGEQPVADLMGEPGIDSLSEVDAAVVTLAERVVRGGAQVTPADIQAARDAGLSDTEIFDVILTVAARCFFSTVIEATGTEPDAAYRDNVAAPLRDLLVVGRPIESPAAVQ